MCFLHGAVSLVVVRDDVDQVGDALFEAPLGCCGQEHHCQVADSVVLHLLSHPLSLHGMAAPKTLVRSCLTASCEC